MIRIIRELRKSLGQIEGALEYFKSTINKLEHAVYEVPNNEDLEVLVSDLRLDNERLEAANVVSSMRLDSMGTEIYRLQSREESVKNQVNTIKEDYERKINEIVENYEDKVKKWPREITQLKEECEKLKKDKYKLLQILVDIHDGEEKEFINEKLLERIKDLEGRIDKDDYCEDDLEYEAIEDEDYWDGEDEDGIRWYHR